MSRKKSYLGGCGCVALAVSTFLIVMGILFAAALIISDKETEEKNVAESKAYNTQIEQLDTIADVELRDSLMAELHPPLIRQVGFASIFGFIFGGLAVVIGIILLIIGIVLIVKHRRRKRRELQDY